MSFGRDDHWSIEMLRIEDEHARLQEMISATSFAVLNTRGFSPRLDALTLLHQRFSRHCRFEEDLAVQADGAMLAVLRADHRDLLTTLGSCRSTLADGNETRSRSLLAEFLEALATHDDAVDGPLFRRMSVSQSVLADCPEPHQTETPHSPDLP